MMIQSINPEMHSSGYHHIFGEGLETHFLHTRKLLLWKNIFATSSVLHLFSLLDVDIYYMSHYFVR